MNFLRKTYSHFREDAGTYSTIAGIVGIMFFCDYMAGNYRGKSDHSRNKPIIEKILDSKNNLEMKCNDGLLREYPNGKLRFCFDPNHVHF